MLSATTVNIGGLPIPVAILILGAALVGAAVLGSIVFAIVSKARSKGKPQQSEFEKMVFDEMKEAGLVAEDAPVSESQHDKAAEDTPVVETLDEVMAPEDESQDDVVSYDAAKTVDSEPLKTAIVPEEEETSEQEQEAPLVKNDETPIEYTEEEEDVPDLIPSQSPDDSAVPAVVETTADTSEEEDEIALAAVDTADEADKDETLLSSMTDEDKDYGDFDFSGDFDEWEDEPDLAEEEDADNFDEDLVAGDDDAYAEESFAEDGLEIADDAAFEVQYEEYADEDDAIASINESAPIVTATADGPRVVPKYRRSFRSKLIQGTMDNKRYYSILKNELMSYDRVRCNESWSGESYMWGRRCYVRIGIVGSVGRTTLCVFLALDPKAYADVYTKLRFRDVSNVHKYASTPMLMRVKSDLSLRRTLRLITHVALTHDLHKKGAYEAVDYAGGLEYRADDALLTINLIKLNSKYVQEVDTAKSLESKEGEFKPRAVMDVTPVKKEQVGNLTEKDLERLDRKRERVDSATRQFASETGKFVIEAEGGKWFFKFYASNGKLLCVGEGCNSRELAFKSVNAYRLGLQSDDIKVSTVDGKYFYTVRVQGRAFVSVMYDSQSACLEGLRLARDTADEAIVEFLI